LKRHRQSQKRKARNNSVKSAVRSEVKAAREATGAPADITKAIKQAQVALARAGTKGVFHKRTVSRRISRLALLQNKLLAQGGVKTDAPAAKGKGSKSGAKATAAKASAARAAKAAKK
jgi:small subunit ribosomal protein S20